MLTVKPQLYVVGVGFVEFSTMRAISYKQTDPQGRCNSFIRSIVVGPQSEQSEHSPSSEAAE